MADPKWLKQLQTQVASAIKEIAKLRRQNKSLTTQLDKTKAAVKAAEEAASKAQAAGVPDPDAEAWRHERKELRRRVARLSKTLEEIA